MTPPPVPVTDAGSLLSSLQAPPLLAGLASASDGRTLFALTPRSVLALDTTLGQAKAELVDPEGNVGAVALSPSGHRLATGVRGCVPRPRHGGGGAGDGAAL